MTEINVGDVVVLKSGGVPMTVEEIGNSDTDAPYAICSWFDKSTYKSQSIMMSALKIYVADTDLFS